MSDFFNNPNPAVEISNAPRENAVMTVTRGETDAAIATARAFPRSLSKFRKSATEMATFSPEIAESCFYKLSRKSQAGGRTIIEGPSIRCAEICAAAYGNMKYASRFLAEEDGYVIVQGVAHDLENNVFSSVEVRRNIKKRDGGRYSDDMVQTTVAAAGAIALRNAILKVIPRAYVDMVYLEAKKCAIGDLKTLPERRANALKFFQQAGVTIDQILKRLGVSAVEDVGLEGIETLAGIRTALKDGETSLEAEFPTEREAAAATAPPATPKADDKATEAKAAAAAQATGADAAAKPMTTLQRFNTVYQAAKSTLPKGEAEARLASVGLKGVFPSKMSEGDLLKGVKALSEPVPEEIPEKVDQSDDFTASVLHAAAEQDGEP